MNDFTTVIRNKDDRERLMDFLRAFDGKEVYVTVEEMVPARSLNQNKRYWLILKLLANETGHDKDELHEILKMKFLGTTEVVFADEKYVRPKSSRRLDKQEFNTYMTQVETFAIETFNIYLGGEDGNF